MLFPTLFQGAPPTHTITETGILLPVIPPELLARAAAARLQQERSDSKGKSGKGTKVKGVPIGPELEVAGNLSLVSVKFFYLQGGRIDSRGTIWCACGNTFYQGPNLTHQEQMAQAEEIEQILVCSIS